MRRRPSWCVTVALLAAVPFACTPGDLINQLSAPGGELSLQLTADSQRVFPSGGRPAGPVAAILQAACVGGAAPYSYQWSVVNPRQEIENERLNALDIPDPVFTGGSVFGEYQVTCVVTDALGTQVFATITVYFGQQMACDLTASRQTVVSGGCDNGSVTLEAKPLGGTPPYSYAWSVRAPSGDVDNRRLGGTASDVKVFTSADVVGTYQIECTITDSTGAIAADSVDIAVSNAFSVNVSAERGHVAPGGGTAGKTYLLADVLGGAPPYTYSWAITGPDGLIDVFRLDNPTSPAPLFTSDSTIGAYRATCTVSGSDGQQVADSIVLAVSLDLAMSIATNRQRVVTGGGANGTAVLSATVMGGVAPYTYSWSVLDEDDAQADNLINDTTRAAPTFTSGGETGTYRIACKVTDLAGQVATDSLEIMVGQQIVGNLNTSSQIVGSGGLSATATWVASGGGWAGQATISAEVIGGTPPYTYTWVALDPSGQPADDRLSGVSPAARTFTSGLVLGTYQVRCTIADSMGVGFTDSVAITVYDALLVDPTIDRQQMPAGGGANGTAHLSVSVAGGTPPYTYVWTITGPDNVTDNARLDDPTIAAPTFTSATLSGIYRATCAVTDAVGQQVSGSILFIVGQPLSVDVTTDRQDVVAGGGQATLSADVAGGVPPYQYAWTVVNPAGVIDNSRLTNATTATPTFTSDLTIGTYTLTCTVMDTAGFSAIESIMLIVGGGLDQGLSVDVTASRPNLPATGEQSSLIAAASGGVAPITYAWTAVDPTGNPAPATLTNANAALATFTVPNPATPGTYRVSCTVTDSVAKTFTDSLHITVGMTLSVTAATDRYSVALNGGSATLNAVAAGGSGTYSAYAWTCTTPAGGTDNARLSSVAVQSPTFTSTTTPGTYTLTCTVTDSFGNTATDAVNVFVGQDLGVDVTTSRFQLVSGGGANGQATLNANAFGGSGTYSTYAWTCTTPAGATDNTRLSATNVQSPTFTSNATVGTYRLTCTVTDSLGSTVTDSVNLVVGQDLALYVTANRVGLVPGGGANGQATLTANATGGSGSYSTYAWTCTTPAGATDNSFLSDPTSATPVFTSTAVVGTYRLACTVTDSFGNTASDALHLEVMQALFVVATTNRYSVALNGGSAILNAVAAGGSGTYSAYAWTCTTPAGGTDNTRLSSAAVQSPTFTSTTTPGTYTLTCTVTDSLGNTATDAVDVFVGQDFGVDVTTSRLQLVSGGGANGQATLNANAFGGSGTYSTYAWTCTTPAGGTDNARLSSTAVQNPTFTSNATVGTYRLTCTVTDSLGSTVTDSVNLVVGQDLALYVTANRVGLVPGGGTNGQATLAANATGGSGTYSTYAWTCTTPAGATDNTRLSSTAVQNPTFTSNATIGTYRLTCTVTDSFGNTATDALHLEVMQGLFVVATTNRYSVALNGGQATLNAVAAGGSGTYSTYAWTCTTPAGGTDNTRLSSMAVQNPTFTSTTTPGTYTLTCTVTDSLGNTASDSVSVFVGQDLGLDVTTSRFQLVPGGGANGTATLNANAFGGSGTYSTYAWTCTTPAGATDNTRLSATNVQSPTFTSNATVGTYRLTCTVTDSLGSIATDSVNVNVTVGQDLALYVTANRVGLVPGGGANGQATLAANATGGSGTYSTYAWTCTTPAGATDNSFLNDPTGATPVFTSTAVVGTYRLACTVTDSFGNTATDALHLEVMQGLFVVATTNRFSVALNGGSATLNAVAAGGSGTYSTYAWTCTTPAGGTDNTRLSSTAVQNPTFTSTTTPGTYTLTCTVTDSLGNTASDAVSVFVGQDFGVDVTTNRVQVVAGGTANGQATLNADAFGGSGTYSTYAWTCTTPAGGTDNTRLSSTAVQSPTFTSDATIGTYRLTCTVTDSLGSTATDSVNIYVGTSLSAAVTTTKQSLTSGDTATLSAAASGGTPAYTYSWTVLNNTGGDVTASVLLGGSTVASPVFTAPIEGGTYRCTCTITDSVGVTFAGAVHVFVATSKLTLTTPASEDPSGNPTSVCGPQNMFSLYTIVELGVDLPYPRNLKVYMIDGNWNINYIWVAVDGVSADGHPQTELFKFTNPRGGTLVTGTMLFSRVDIIRYVRSTGLQPSNSDETVQIGVGNTFGLPEIIPSASSVRRVVQLPATTLTTPAEYSVVTTPGRQGINFTDPAHQPNGARSYDIYYDDN